jgi:L-alanine-DL-glutamate epimerase-like enolase superfamily enzyme
MSTTAADRTAVIAKIETVPLRIPFKAGNTSDASLWGDKLPGADSLLVKVTTDTGMEGWGEAFGFGAVASAKLAVDDLSCGQSPVRFGLSSGS